MLDYADRLLAHCMAKHVFIGEVPRASAAVFDTTDVEAMARKLDSVRDTLEVIATASTDRRCAALARRTLKAIDTP